LPPHLIKNSASLISGKSRKKKGGKRKIKGRGKEGEGVIYLFLAVSIGSYLDSIRRKREEGGKRYGEKKGKPSITSLIGEEERERRRERGGGKQKRTPVSLPVEKPAYSLSCGDEEKKKWKNKEGKKEKGKKGNGRRLRNASPTSLCVFTEQSREKSKERKKKKKKDGGGGVYEELEQFSYVFSEGGGERRGSRGGEEKRGKRGKREKKVRMLRFGHRVLL